MLRRDADSRPDGAVLAANAAAANSGKIWITVTKKNGEKVNKLVDKRKPAPIKRKPTIKTGLGIHVNAEFTDSDCDGGNTCNCRTCTDARANVVPPISKRSKDK